MLSENETVAQNIVEMMKAEFTSIGIESLVYVSKINNEGIKLI